MAADLREPRPVSCVKEFVPPLALVKQPHAGPHAGPRATGCGELDPLILRRAQASDPAAAHALVDFYQRRVFAFVGRMLGPLGAARVEDVCQECFLRVFRALPRFDPTGPARLSTWIFTIAARLCADDARRRRPADPLPDDDRHLPPSPLADAAEVAAARALQRRIEHALASLPDDLRATFVLRVTLDLPVAEVARALDVDEGTVKSRLSRTRARLRELLGDVLPPGGSHES